MSQDIDIAWAAGLFEGEGCIHVTKQPQFQLSLGMTDRDVVDRFCRIVGVGSVGFVDRSHLGTKNIHLWRVSSRRDVIEVLSLLMFHFGDRRYAKATEVLQQIVALETV